MANILCFDRLPLGYLSLLHSQHSQREQAQQKKKEDILTYILTNLPLNSTFKLILIKRNCFFFAHSLCAAIISLFIPINSNNDSQLFGHLYVPLSNMSDH